MRIIRQFKQGRTAKSIYKSLRNGDVFVLAVSSIKYIVGQEGYIISEKGHVYDCATIFFAGEKMRAIYKQESGTGELLEDLLRAAESDIRKEWS